MRVRAQTYSLMAVTLSTIYPRRMKLRSEQTNLVPGVQQGVQLQVQSMTSFLVDGRVPGQSGSSPALCRSRFFTKVPYLPLLPYSGIYLDTAYYTLISPKSTQRITQDRVAVTLVTEARSKIVSFCIEGAPKGRSLWEKEPKGRLQRACVLLDTLKMPPVKAPPERQCQTVAQTGVQSMARAVVIMQRRNIEYVMSISFAKNDFFRF